MKNNEIARIFYDIADILEIKGIAWKPNAFRKAARSLENLSQDIEDIYKKSSIEGLREIPGIGEGISKKIVEYLKTGKIKEYEKLKRSIPSGVEDLMSIQSLGPKKAWRLYKELKIRNIEQLEKAALSGKIRKLEGFGIKSEKDILEGISLNKIHKSRRLLGEALPYADNLLEKIKKIKYIHHADVAGSIRRRLETIGDIDILVTSTNPGYVMDHFTKLEEIKTVLAKGTTKASVVLRNGMNCDLRVIDDKSYGAALLYFTGNKEHNIVMRQIAIKKGYKLSEYGLFDKHSNALAGKTEKEVYKKLSLPYFEPEMRENTGELEDFSKKQPPRLIQYDSIKGDIHMHTLWSDGHYNVEAMVNSAINLGYKYIAITDHSKSSYIANGMDEKKILKYINEIDKIAKKYKNIEVLKGSEVDILKNGLLDYSNNILSRLDVVIASIHSSFKMPKQEMTSRILKAISNKYVNILAHPTGRLINQRQPYEFDMEKIMDIAKENNIALEINAFPTRLDLKDIYIKQAVKNSNKMVINTDSHALDHLNYMHLGIAQARRGWATEKDIINSWPLQRFKKFISR